MGELIFGNVDIYDVDPYLKERTHASNPSISEK